MLSDYRLDPICNDSIIKLIEKGENESVLRHNLLLVYKIVNEYKHISSSSYDDLVQEACQGLLHAIDRYDPSAGASFATYSSHWIHQKIRRYLPVELTIRMPTNVYQRVNKVKTEMAIKGRKLSIKEVSELLNITELSAKNIQRTALASSVSLDDSGINEVVGENDSDLSSEDEYKVLEDSMHILSEREQDILCRRFGLRGHKPEKLREICAIYNLSRERIRQIESDALYKLKMKLYDMRN